MAVHCTYDYVMPSETALYVRLGLAIACSLNGHYRYLFCSGCNGLLLERGGVGVGGMRSIHILTLLLLLHLSHSVGCGWWGTCSSHKSTPVAFEPQPVNPRSLIRLLVIRMKKLCTVGYPKCAQGRFWSDCARNALADMNRRSLGAHVQWYVFWRRRSIVYTVLFYKLYVFWRNP